MCVFLLVGRIVFRAAGCSCCWPTRHLRCGGSDRIIYLLFLSLFRLQREEMMAHHFLRTSFVHLFWSFTLLELTRPPTPCSLPSSTWWIIHRYRVCLPVTCLSPLYLAMLEAWLFQTYLSHFIFVMWTTEHACMSWAIAANSLKDSHSPFESADTVQAAKSLTLFSLVSLFVSLCSCCLYVCIAQSAVSRKLTKFWMGRIKLLLQTDTRCLMCRYKDYWIAFIFIFTPLFCIWFF